MNKPLPQAGWHLSLCGDAAVLPHGAPPVLLERRAAALLALAALEPGISRLRAASMLWPDSADPRRNLRQQLLRFKQQFGRALLDGEDALVLAADVGVDASGEGVLLAAHAYEDCEDFAGWLERQRASRRAGRCETLRQQLAQAEADGDLERALRAAEQRVEADPDSEDAMRELMRIHYLRDDAAAGLAVHRRLTAQLHKDHGTTPTPATERLARALRDAVPQPRPSVSPRLSPALPPTLLRPPRLIGRQPEMRQADDALAAGQAVLLLGKAGMGKSRLSAELLRQVMAGRAPLRPASRVRSRCPGCCPNCATRPASCRCRPTARCCCWAPCSRCWPVPGSIGWRWMTCTSPTRPASNCCNR